MLNAFDGSEDHLIKVQGYNGDYDMGISDDDLEWESEEEIEEIDGGGIEEGEICE